MGNVCGKAQGAVWCVHCRAIGGGGEGNSLPHHQSTALPWCGTHESCHQSHQDPLGEY